MGQSASGASGTFSPPRTMKSFLLFLLVSFLKESFAKGFENFSVNCGSQICWAENPDPRGEEPFQLKRVVADGQVLMHIEQPQPFEGPVKVVASGAELSALPAVMKNLKIKLG